MNEMDRLLSNARLAQDERKRAEKTLEVAKKRERDAVDALQKATDALKAELPPSPVEHDEIVLSDDGDGFVPAHDSPCDCELCRSHPA
jgi:hypothetical protein